MEPNYKAKFRLIFDPAWVLTKRGDGALPVEKFVEQVTEKLDANILTSNLTECTGVVTLPEDIGLVELENKVREIVGALYEGENFRFDIKVEQAEEPVNDETEPEKKSAHEPIILPDKKAKVEANADEISKKIDELIGAQEFKEFACETIQIAPVVRKYGSFDTITERCCLISINDGCGLSTYLELYAELLESLKLFSPDRKKCVEEIKLPPRKAEGQTERFNQLASMLARSKNKIISMDISEWMTASDDIEFRKILALAAECAGLNIIFFRVPFVEQNVLEELRQNINDMVFVRTLSIVPFDSEELDSFAKKMTEERGFTIDDGAMEIFRERINEEKNDGRFYGIKTVKKVVLEMLYRKQLSEAISGSDSTVITSDEIAGLSENGSTLGLSGMEMLDQLVGMESIRDQVLEIIAQIEARIGNDNLEAPCIHMRFVGNPGTGKTTVARIIGRILREKGILRNGSFLEHSGRDLCGRFVGETAPRTAAICRDAYGSVLFIDEAYTLFRDNMSSRADYGREALDTLIAEMENHRSDLMVIMAGYPQEMEDLMQGNPGLESRMPYKIEFPNYTREQLAEIFLSMTRKSFTCGEGLESAVRTYFSGLSEELMSQKDFSNARFVRNLFERTWAKAALRCQMSSEKCTEILPEDLSLATGEKDFSQINEKGKSRAIGFI